MTHTPGPWNYEPDSQKTDRNTRLDVFFDVHGSVTYGKNHLPREEPNGLWWFGFDCSHASDFTPYNPICCREDGIYRDIGYVTREVESLAEQLAGVSNAKGVGDYEG